MLWVCVPEAMVVLIARRLFSLAPRQSNCFAGLQRGEGRGEGPLSASPALVVSHGLAPHPDCFAIRPFPALRGEVRIEARLASLHAFLRRCGKAKQAGERTAAPRVDP